jgi:hypothetical protein
MTQLQVVRYTTTAQARDENARLVGEVYSALARTQPDGLRYATLLIPDGNAFIHIAVRDAAENPLVELPAFQAFQRDLGERVLAPPDSRPATLVGNYRLLL